MEHSFNVYVAKQYGIQCAVLLNNLYYWIEKNKANNKHFHNDMYWTYNSKKAFTELFPYMTERQIDYALKKLVDEGIIITDNFNQDGRDRTLWYSITNKGYAMLQNCEMQFTNLLNANDKIVEPLPNNKLTNTNKEILSNDNKESDDVTEAIEYLNETCFRHFKTSSQSIRKLIKARLNEGYTLDDLKMVIDLKAKQWLNSKMEMYLRPDTLFNATKFANYYGECSTSEVVETYGVYL